MDTTKDRNAVIKIDKQLGHRVKVEAAIQGRTMKEVTTGLLLDWLRYEEERRARTPGTQPSLPGLEPARRVPRTQHA